MQTSHNASLSSKDTAGRPAVSVYWVPGCSMCLNTKEFLEKRGIEYESINCLDDPAGREELMSAGLRGLPVVRLDDRFQYVQSLDVLAEFMEIPRGDHTRFTQEELVERWEAILTGARPLVASLPEDVLARRAMTARPRTVLELSSHVFQIPDVFVRIVEEGLFEFYVLQNDPRPDIMTRMDLLEFIDHTMDRFLSWRSRGGVAAIPSTISTYLGEQPGYRLLERAVWHSAQHVRQLDAISVGLGGEIQVPTELYKGLPMPERLWA